uniref:Pentacotripeptide-repeat region of PRORP domain-containing protein n=1 Tax=Setaria italica TaxID=4555 RepID=K3XPK8_SETIT
MRPPLSASLFNSLIASRARAGRSAEALSLLARMLAAGVAPTAFTFAPILSSPSATACCAAQLHPHILKSGLLHCEPYSGTSLVGFFGRSGRFDEALKVFGEMTVRSVVTWNCLISSFVQFGRSHDALFWFRELVRSSDGLSDGSLVAVLPAFGSPVEVHAVANALLSSYCTCGSIQVAEKMFNELVMNGHEHGKFIHAKVIKRNLNTSVFVSTSLVDFYANCIGWRDAHKVFKEVPENSTTCWNALISAHSDSDGPTSLVILRDMLRSGIKPNEVTFSASLKDPSLLALQQIHSLVTRLGHGGNDYVSSGFISSYASHGVVSDALTYGVALDPDSCSVSMNALAGVYNKARSYKETKELLLHQQSRDTVSWCILITACARNGDCIEAFGFFKQMRILGHRADNYVFVSLLSICTKNNSLDLGKSIHGLIIKTNSGCSDTYVDNVLLDMYAKCGRIEDCLRVFEELKDRNLISWTAVISGLGLSGFSHKALAWFKAMEKDGCKPDKVAILAVLSACRHGRLVKEGMKIFKNMKADYSVEAEMEHYICVVDMLCKCGYLKEAEVVIRGMPFQPSSVIWRTFLQGCKTYGVTETQVFS